uniref:molybdopterin biosynthesis protein n=1 Tax=Porphyridium aerugineum TaxID=2792 RepID=UPI001FCCCA3A|nr:molybdopterin biosynthesis protein [Porphyridium aerugineum]UNJ17898.1 molybdopterin biosynthesis protein [Porphyridium aerugineum]
MLNSSSYYTNNDFSIEEYTRYTRHLNLSMIQKEGQQRIKEAKVLSIGSGGLASTALLYLAASGIGQIGIIDDDYVDLSNLQRQILYSTQSIGEKKVSAAKKKLMNLNPNTFIQIYDKRLDNLNAYSIIADYDIVMDATDNIESRYLLHKVCTALNKVYIYGAISQLKGQISIFNYQNSANYSDISDNIDLGNNDCRDNGVLGMLPGTVGLLEATEIIKVILGIPSSLKNQLLVYDAVKMTFLRMNFKKSKRRTFFNRKSEHLESVKAVSNSFKLNQDNVVNQKNMTLLKVIIDIRDSYEFSQGSIIHAINIPLYKLLYDTNIDFLKEEALRKDIYIFCTNNVRSSIAIRLLRKYEIYAYIY